jgi:signal peptidase I
MSGMGAVSTRSTLPDEAHRAKKSALTTVIGVVLPWLLMGCLGFAFRPVSFGGSTGLTIVSGHSMERTYHTGDLVITRSASRYAVGDIIVFKVPEGVGAGRDIVHRIKSIDRTGRFLTQGDNNDFVDPWPLQASDIVGAKWLMIPRGGDALVLLRSPLMAAIVLGLLAVWALWPRPTVNEGSIDQTVGETGGETSDAGPSEGLSEIDRALEGLCSEGNLPGTPRELPRPQLPVSHIPTESGGDDDGYWPEFHWLDADGIPDVWVALYEAEI